MLKNSPERWGSAAKAFHWIIVALIVVIVPAGYLMSYTYGLALRDKGLAQPLSDMFSQIHHTLGLTILVLVIGRLAWRLFAGGPAPRSDPQRFALQDWASKGVHGALYLLLFLLPLSGWSALSVYGLAPIWLFNLKGVVPGILPVLPLKSPFGYGFFAHIHVWAIWAGAGLVTVHVAAALWHHFGWKDNVLHRMWPLAKPS